MIHGKYAEELIWYCYSIVSLINFPSQREEKYLLRLAGLVRDKVTVRPTEKHGHFCCCFSLSWTQRSGIRNSGESLNPKILMRVMVFIWLSEAPWKHLTIVLFFQSYWEVCYYCWGNFYRKKVNSQRQVLGVWLWNISYFWNPSNTNHFLKEHPKIFKQLEDSHIL